MVEKSALVLVMAWHQIVASHCLNQCEWWPSFLMHIWFTSSQWVNPCCASAVVVGVDRCHILVYQAAAELWSAIFFIFWWYDNCLTLNVRGLSLIDQYHGCWCPGSLRRQDISTHDIEYVLYVCSCPTWGRISTTCVMSMWRNDMKCKYMFLFPLKNLAHILDICEYPFIAEAGLFRS